MHHKMVQKSIQVIFTKFSKAKTKFQWEVSFFVNSEEMIVVIVKVIIGFFSFKFYKRSWNTLRAWEAKILSRPD